MRASVAGSLLLSVALIFLSPALAGAVEPAAVSARADAGAPNLEGAWQGALQVGAVSLRLVVKIKRNGADLSATVDSLDQGAHDIGVDTVVFDGHRLLLTLAKLNASYEARIDRDTLVGTWKQGASVLPLTLRRTGSPPVVRPRPQEPNRPLPYDEIEVAVDNPSGHARLACTLTKPRRPGRFGAAVLVSGSGPQNRDGELLGHRPFLVLSDAITRTGVAVLRCDDRGFGKSTGDFSAATTFEFAADALAEVAALRARADIDPAHVGLVGHSEGALIAAVAAARSKEVAFIALLAAPGLPGDKIVELQAALISGAMGESDAEATKAQALQHQINAIVKREKDDLAAAKQLRARYAALPEAERKAWESRGGNLDAELKAVLSPWFRTFLSLDPRTYLSEVKVPVLAISGERDLQVPSKVNLPEIRKALKGNRDVTIRELPGLNHLFQTCKTGSPDEYAQLDETMAPAALAIVSDWLQKHAQQKRPPR